MMNKKRWLGVELIDYFTNKNYINNGLTIPFIIGAIKEISGNYLSISELIAKLVDKNNSPKMTILYCGNIGEHVIGVMDDETESYYKEANTYKHLKSFGSVIVTDKSLDHIETLGDLKSFFEDKYQDCISKEKYSKMRGAWHNFSDTDLSRINEIKYKR